MFLMDFVSLVFCSDYFIQVVYVAATVPYLFLMILLVRGLFFDGSLTGLLYFVEPRWEKLLNFSVM
jgi:hypothetical protein